MKAAIMVTVFLPAEVTGETLRRTVEEGVIGSPLFLKQESVDVKLLWEIDEKPRRRGFFR